MSRGCKYTKENGEMLEKGYTHRGTGEELGFGRKQVKAVKNDCTQRGAG